MFIVQGLPTIFDWVYWQYNLLLVLCCRYSEKGFNSDMASEFSQILLPYLSSNLLK